ncbi:MAG: molybdenum cofactor biosynthesis protein MoaE [Deltaproteobacteria bacterium]|nr:molybdenum cofactor biosynthesis protein MoaE [Deltaproteobacteria bacterium]
MGTLTLRHFAAAKELAGRETEPLDWAAGTVADLKAALGARGGRWTFLAACARYARDDEFLRDGDALHPDDEVLVLPPASGGGSRAVLVETAIEPGAAERLVDLDGTGGIATFVGTVRRQSRGLQVVHLEFSAYPPLATKELDAICGEAIARFGLVDARAIHRLGRVEIGEVAVAIACAAPHRGAAFDGCRYVIDELKQRVPIWKRESTTDGAVWIGSTP